MRRGMGFLLALLLTLLALGQPTARSVTAPNAVITIEKHWIGASSPASTIVVKDARGTEVKSFATTAMTPCPEEGEGCARANVGVVAPDPNRVRKGDGPFRVSEQGLGANVVSSFSGDCDGLGRITARPATRSTCIVTNVVADVVSPNMNAVIGIRKTWEPNGSSYPDGTIKILGDRDTEIASFLASSMRKYDAGTASCDSSARAAGPCEWLVGINVPPSKRALSVRYSVVESGFPGGWYGVGDVGCTSSVRAGQFKICSLANVETIGDHDVGDDAVLTITHTFRGVLGGPSPRTISVFDQRGDLYRTFSTNDMRCVQDVCTASVSTRVVTSTKKAGPGQLRVSAGTPGFLVQVYGGECSRGGFVTITKSRTRCTATNVVGDYLPDGMSAVIAVTKRFVGPPDNGSFSVADAHGDYLSPGQFNVSDMRATDGSSSCLTYAAAGGTCESLIGVVTRGGRGAQSYVLSETPDASTVAVRGSGCRGQIEPGQVRECEFTDIHVSEGVTDHPTAAITVTKAWRGDHDSDPRTITVTDSSRALVAEFTTNDMSPCPAGLCMNVGLRPSAKLSAFRVNEAFPDVVAGEQHLFGGDCAGGRLSAVTGTYKTCSITNVEDDLITPSEDAVLAITKVFDGHPGPAELDGVTFQVFGSRGTSVTGGALPLTDMRPVPDNTSCQASGAAGGTCEFLIPVAGTDPTRLPQRYTVLEAGLPAGWVAIFDNCDGTVKVGSIRECTITNVKTI